MQFTFDNLPQLKLEYGKEYKIFVRPEGKVAWSFATLYKIRTAQDNGYAVHRSRDKDAKTITFKIPEKNLPTAKRFPPGLYYLDLLAGQSNQEGSGTGYTINLA